MCEGTRCIHVLAASGKLAEEMYEMDPEHPGHRCVGRPPLGYTFFVREITPDSDHITTRE